MDNGYTATDIITYIGVPLAVLGVLPILFNTFTTLLTLSKVRRLLRKSRLAGITRGDVINKIIEAELARFAIAPLDRELNSGEYWSVYENPSLVPGGSWTIFNWKLHSIGVKTQRIEYADQLRQPQAEIGFEELVGYLLDLGAVPSPAGLKMLRTSGLWIPTGTPILLSPDRTEGCLMVAPLDDSDGNLALSVKWSRKWKMRYRGSLPPYWISINAPPTPEKPTEEAGRSSENAAIVIEDAPIGDVVTGEKIAPKPISKPSSTSDLQKEFVPSLDTKSTFTSTSTTTTSSTTTFFSPRSSAPQIRFHITAAGLGDALLIPASQESSLHLPITELAISHLSSIPSSSNDGNAGKWFASACTAVSHTLLWSFIIPPAISTFSTNPSLPCGILVLLNIIELSATPEWSTTHTSPEAQRLADNEMRHKRMRETMAATMREQSMNPADRQKAVRERMMKQHQDFVDDLSDKRRREVAVQETRMVEALGSPKWAAALVSSHLFTYLKSQNLASAELEVAQAVEGVLGRMVMERAFAADVMEMLERWKAWTDNGGMRGVDYEYLRERKETFAWASLILGVIAQAGNDNNEDSVAEDLRVCLGVWKKVRLG